MDKRTAFNLAGIKAEDYPVTMTVRTYRSILNGEIDDAIANKRFWPTPDYFTTAKYDARKDFEFSLRGIAADRQFKVFGWLNANRHGQEIPYFGNAEDTADRIFNLLNDYGRAIWSAGEDADTRARLVNAFCDRLRTDLTQWGTWKTIKTDIMASVEDAHSVVHDEWNKVIRAKA